MPGLVSCSDMKVVAVSTLGWDPLVSVAAELMRAGIAIPAASIRDNPDSLSDLLPKWGDVSELCMWSVCALLELQSLEHVRCSDYK